jgi:hypothetical protein
LSVSSKFIFNIIKKAKAYGWRCHAKYLYCVFATLDFYCVFICNCRKKGEGRGYKSVTLETMMNTKADKAEKKITHHVPPRQMIYTKKQIGLNHEKR